MINKYKKLVNKGKKVRTIQLLQPDGGPGGVRASIVDNNIKIEIENMTKKEQKFQLERIRNKYSNIKLKKNGNKKAKL